VRRTIETRRRSKRDVIMVFDASRQYQSGSGLSYFEACPLRRENGWLGILRPTQRYVLQGGLDRAEGVNKFLAEQCSDDPWGFVRATYDGAGEPVALTPPVIEQVWREDWDSDDTAMLEFLVCDGNHRIVQKVWRSREVTPAIGVVGEPRQPYYARPFSPYEWDITAENIVSVTPEPRFKYAPRTVDLDRLDLSDEARLELSEKQAKQPGDLYRRYYRDLTAGFGPMGGQGGRWA
jgi:hypothetical protein